MVPSISPVLQPKAAASGVRRPNSRGAYLDSAGPVIDKIIRAIASAENKDPSNLELSLENHICTDTIRGLVTHDSNSWRLQFETENHVVEVMGDDTVLVDGETKQITS